MVEVTGNLWTYPNADVRVITTNGTVKKNGECVMGRGCAAEAKKVFPPIAAYLGELIAINGNHMHALGQYPTDADARLYSFPVKHHWMEKADLKLIERSARELVAAIDALPIIPLVVMPRPGCGNGHLLWKDVRPVLAPILDDRFHVITF